MVTQQSHTRYRTRFVYNSKVKEEHVVQEVLLCGRAELVKSFHRANAFANKAKNKTQKSSQQRNVHPYFTFLNTVILIL